MGDKQQPRNTTLTILGEIDLLPKQATCLVEQADHHNLVMDIEVNWCLACPKAKAIPVILVNTNKIWLMPHLLAAKLYNVEYHPWEYITILNQGGK